MSPATIVKCMLPTLDNVYFMWAARRRLVEIKQAAKNQLLSVLLYTEEDEELAFHVRQHYGTLDRISGPCCDVFVIERPYEYDYLLTNPDYIPEEQAQDSRYLQGTPFNKATAIDIARQLGIFADQLPCIAFFKDLENKEDVVVFPIEGDLTKFFRTLFGSIERQLHYTSDNAPFIFDDIKLKLSSLGQKAAEEPTRVQYVYNGQTLYINHTGVDLSGSQMGDVSIGDVAGGDIHSRS